MAAVRSKISPITGRKASKEVRRRQLIDRALATLSEELRVAVTLRDLQGMDYKEIAAVLDVPIGTVESRIFRARQKLKPLLAALMTED